MAPLFSFRILAWNTAILWILAIGCSHPMNQESLPLRSNSPMEEAALTANEIRAQSNDSHVEIEYILSRDHYRFFVSAAKDLITAGLFMNNKQVEQGSVDSSRYPDFLQKAYHFVHSSSRPEKNAPLAFPCHPFTVTVRIQGKTEAARGCRSSKNGTALSKLVREGEFLLYSKN